MIFKSFQILAICTSMAVTPSNFHYEEVKKANENTPYTHTISSSNFVGDYNNNGQNIQYSRKFDVTEGYNEFMLHLEKIAQSTYYNSNGVGYFELSNNVQYDQTPTILNLIQLSPYKNLVNNTVNFKQQLNLKTISADAGSSDVKMTTEIYHSTDARWINYFNRTTWNTRNSNIDLILDVENASNGFIYTKNTYTTNATITPTSGLQNFQTNYSIQIDPNNTNYIFAITYLNNIQQGQETGIVTILSTTGSYLALLPDGNNLMQISGESINANITYEIIDVPSVMFEVLTMPFTFISIAFNLTIFPNTPYQVNISNLFLSIIGFLVFILIIKKLTGH